MISKILRLLVMAAAALAILISFQNCSSKSDQFSSSGSEVKPVISAGSCPQPLVANGLVGAFPGCSLTCNSGFTQSNGECLATTGGSCPVPLVANGTIGSAPGCSLTCNTGFTQSLGACIPSACSTTSVQNGTVAAYPSCAIACNSGYQLSGNTCVPAAVTSGAYSCSSTGVISSYSISANVNVASSDIGKAGAYFVVGLFGGNYYSYDGTGWTQYNGSNATGFQTASLSNVVNYPLATDANLYGYSGAQLYVGYGVGGNISASLNDLLATNKFAACGQPLPAATAASFSCNNTGTATNFNVKANAKVASADLGKPGAYFVVGYFGGNYYTYDGVSWTQYNGSNATGFSTASLADITNYSLFTNTDVTGYSGVQLYLGYGVGSSTSAALENLLLENKFAQCGAALP